MTPADQSNQAIRGVMHCQEQFWQALQAKDDALFAQILADDFVCHAPDQAEQLRAAFIATLTCIPLIIVSMTGEQIAVRVFDQIAVLTGIQVAQLRLPDGSHISERLALTNIFRQTAGHWQMVLAHPVPLPK